MKLKLRVWLLAMIAISVNVIAVTTPVYAAMPAQPDDQPSVSASAPLSKMPLAERVAASNKHLGRLFLRWNAKQPGVVTLKSGLQYKVIKAGHGQQPTATSQVTVDYEGQFINGHVFDSSYARKAPITFSLDGVIAGWREALQLMHEGDEWVLYIPSALAYGDRGVPGKICANETLLFKVHLLKVDS